MYHYIINVPNDSKSLITKETVCSRLDEYNSDNRYLMYDSGDSNWKRYILIDETELTDELLVKLKNLFEAEIKVDAVDPTSVDRNRLEKIHVAKELMVNQYCCGRRKPLIIEETTQQLIRKANAMIGLRKYKQFISGLVDYIDRTASLKLKPIYNVVLINKSGIKLDPQIELIYGIFASKGLLLDQVITKGNIDDAKYMNCETRCVYVIEDSWKTSDKDEFSERADEDKLLATVFNEDSDEGNCASGMTSLFSKIIDRNNIYITTMKQDEYDKVSRLDGFSIAFPHVVTIDEYTNREKTNLICAIAKEYGFSVDRESFSGKHALSDSSIPEIENTVRSTITRKLVEKDNSFTVCFSDLTLKVKKKQKASALSELEGLIGLDGVKKTIKEIVAFLKNRGRSAVPCLHMAFLGNPGTGKTTIARVLAKVFAETGVTKRNLFVETSRGGLIAKYVGHSAAKTAQRVESALGGVLFIDEAYSLALCGDERDSFGEEALSTLVKLMEDKRDEFVCILAGYTDEMNTMIDVNPGLRDRIQFYVDFPDYSDNELLQIFEALCKEKKYRLSPAAKTVLQDAFKRMIRAKSRNFANGRVVRKVFERVRLKQAIRTASDTLARCDVEAALAEEDIAALLNNNVRPLIGFKVPA